MRRFTLLLISICLTAPSQAFLLAVNNRPYPNSLTFLHSASTSTASSSNSSSSKRTSRNAHQTVNAILDEFVQELQITLPRQNPKSSLQFILNQLSELEPQTAGPRAERLVRRIVQSTTNSSTSTTSSSSSTAQTVQLKAFILNKVLACYSKTVSCQTSHAMQTKMAHAAHQFFRQWQEWYHNNGDDTTNTNANKLVQETVDRVSYNTLISIYSRAKDCDKAEEVFQDLQNHSATSSDTNENDENRQHPTAYTPDAISYSSLLHANAVAGRAERVRELFQHMLDHGPTPNIYCYNDVLYAYSKAQNPTAAEEFLRWWKTTATTTTTTTTSNDTKMATSTSSTSTIAPPQTQSYNIVLHALATDRTVSWVRAEKWFLRMPRRDAVSYTTFCAAACARLRSPLALETVRRVMQRAWEDRHVQVTASLLSNVIFSLANSSSSSSSNNNNGNSNTNGNSSGNANTNTDDAGFAQLAQELVDEFVERQQQSGSNKDSATAMIDLYNALIYCWSQSSSPQAVAHVLALLELVERDPQLTPNVKTYTNVLNALKSRGVEAIAAAETILARMEQVGPAPNVQSYTALIQNYARSKHPFKAKKAWDVLKRMQKQNPTTTRAVSPNIVSYNAVLNACEYTDAKNPYATEEALKVALLSFDEIRDNPHIAPSHVTYGTFLGVLANLMPSETRQEIVELVFRRCAHEGQVSRLVLKKVQEAADPTRLEQILQGHAPNQLPKEWTCYVREGRARQMS